MLIDDKNDDRKIRNFFLNKNLKYFGMSQIEHLQYDYINCLVLCENIEGN